MLESKMIEESLLNEESNVESKVGHVANFDLVRSSIENDKFLGLTKEELLEYVNDGRWKRIRWMMGITYILLIIFLLVSSILLIVTSPGCPPRRKLHWYEKELIYEIDVVTFRDSNGDAFGDIQGVQEKMNYLQKNHIKSLLFRPSIFNHTYHWNDGQTRINLHEIDPIVAKQKEFDDFVKSIHRKEMHLIIDLPLSSTIDPDSSFQSNSIQNRCVNNGRDLLCDYYQSYGQFPLDFNNQSIQKQSQMLIDEWLMKKKLDGIRVNVPLKYNLQKKSFEISLKTIEKWNEQISNITKKSKTKLLLIDVPFSLEKYFPNKTIDAKLLRRLFSFNDQQNYFNPQLLKQRLKSFDRYQFPSNWLFWQLGSTRTKNETKINIPKEMLLTMNLLIGGTPIILYGEEIHLDQMKTPLMPWTPQVYSGEFSSCLSIQCQQIFSKYQNQSASTSVKREEALGGSSKDSSLKLFAFLSKLRQLESFEFGSLKYDYDEQLNIFWLIREAPAHRGFIIVLNFNTEDNHATHLSLIDVTKNLVPSSVHIEYQWPKWNLLKSNHTSIDSDNLLIDPHSINIFSWKTKLIKQNILFQD